MTVFYSIYFSNTVHCDNFLLALFSCSTFDQDHVSFDSSSDHLVTCDLFSCIFIVGLGALRVRLLFSEGLIDAFAAMSLERKHGANDRCQSIRPSRHVDRLLTRRRTDRSSFAMLLNKTMREFV